MRKYLLAAAAAALFAASPAAAAGFNGVVVARSGGAIAVATPAGVVRTIHGSARVGAVVRVSDAHVAVLGTARRATLRGVVVRRVGSTQFLAAGGTMLAVHARSRAVAAVGDGGPAPGTVVQDTVSVSSNGTLTQQSSQTVGQAGNVSVQATVTSVGALSIALVADASRWRLAPEALTNIPGTAVSRFPLKEALALSRK